MLHSPPISSSLIWPSQNHLLNSANYEATQAMFTFLLIFPFHFVHEVSTTKILCTSHFPHICCTSQSSDLSPFTTGEEHK
jgi:hypothetical protein